MNPRFQTDKPSRLNRVNLRVAAVILTSACSFMGIGAAFLREEARYEVPETAPKDWKAPELGQIIQHPALQSNAKALLLHFHSEQCPCSRYAINHVRDLAQRFRGEVEVVVVTQENAGDYTWAGRRVVDHDGSLARSVGVYASSQAAILAPNGRLIFRGSYNRTRFCSDPATQYTRIALESFLQGKRIPENTEAGKAFGCALAKGLAKGKIS